MISTTLSCSLRGLTGVPVTVEADVANGLPAFTIVGLTDRSIQEARERVRAAVRNAGFAFPQKRLTVNLAPAEIPKEGTSFDLAIALAVLRSSGHPLQLGATGLVGELALDGSVRPVAGVLPMVRALRRAGVRRVAVPADNAAEAALVEGVEVIPVPSLAVCVEHFEGTRLLRPATATPAVPDPGDGVDLAAVRGQGGAKRALEIAAAGGHNLLLLGPPGAGKTMLARAFATLLPDLDADAALDVAALYSLRGTLRDRSPTTLRPPFRAPHHSVSRAGLVGGGGTRVLPGEISLAHGGVLFLDEVCEFPRGLLEALRQPLEERAVAVTRARGNVVFPADFTLLAAANPCPCGQRGSSRPACSCSSRELTEYAARLSGPLRDRIDLVVSVPRQPFEALFSGAVEEASATVRGRVEAARTQQRDRAAVLGLPVHRLNAHLTGALLSSQAVGLTAGATSLLAAAGERLALSGRGFHRVARVARTIADLAGAAQVEEGAVAEALRLRTEVAS